MRDCGSLKRAQNGRETCPFRAPNGFNEIRLSALERMAGTTRLELATSAVTGQRSNQLNYVPNRGINDLAQNLANKAFARFAYSARFAFLVKECGCFRRNRHQTAYKYLRAHARLILARTQARGEPVSRSAMC